MDSLQFIALILLCTRAVIVYFLIKILNTQAKLNRAKLMDEKNNEVTDPDILLFRRNLNLMTIAMMVGNIPAVILDVAVLFGEDRTTPYLVIYALANAFSMLVAVIMINSMYKLSRDKQALEEFEKKQLVANKRKK